MSDELKWIKHDGGPMPVPGDTVVAVNLGNGREVVDPKSDWICDTAGWWKEIWTNGGITEYAIVRPSPSADTTNPAHYKTGDVECIDAIRAQLTPEQFKGYLKASLVKYVWRYEHKGAALADLEKGKWFLERLIGEVRDAAD